MSWNPVGWIVLAVVALVAIYTYWDEICDFFSWLGHSISYGAKVIWEFVTSPPVVHPPPAIDDTLPAPVLVPPVDVPLPNSPLTIAPPKPISIPITTTKPRVRNRDKDIFNVYDLHINVPGEYREYTWGKGYDYVNLNIRDIWKYGLTSFKSVYLRYLVISKLWKDDKEEYIFGMLSDGKFAPKQWYMQNQSRTVAHNEEVRLIDDYKLRHGKYPAGNTYRN